MRYTDPDLKYCPRCDEEYRAEISTCVSCAVALITGSEKLAVEQEVAKSRPSRSMELSSDDEMADIRKGPLGEMKHLQTVLAANSIPSLIGGEKGGCGKGCCGGGEVYLRIRIEDGQEAMAVLAQEFKRTTALDSYDLSNIHAVYDRGAEQTTCPACGFVFSTDSSTCPDCGLCF
ncbi:MAG: hypothetical protein KJ804_03585 [Proteobacteria bacterium]|nr:hypothetical protein [Pseudomonadota bacterium]MBU1057386.1 hypothetical protein [Pseudomonadota bacterium]